MNNFRDFDIKFWVNDYITLELENDNTIIYLNYEKLDVCKYLLLDIAIDEIKSLNELQSIDEAKRLSLWNLKLVLKL